jgi:hypothetical protein
LAKTPRLEWENLEKGESKVERIIKEVELKVQVPNFSKLYGVDYGVFEDIIAFRDLKIEQL